MKWKKNKIAKPKVCAAKILLTTKYKTKMFSNLDAKSIYDQYIQNKNC